MASTSARSGVGVGLLLLGESNLLVLAQNVDLRLGKSQLGIRDGGGKRGGHE